MKIYICYANEDRMNAIRLNKELRQHMLQTTFIDRGDSDLLTDPMEDIMKGIKESECFAVIHSAYTNTSMLSQIEITYAKNLHKQIHVIKTGHTPISDSIKFELGNANVINDSNMAKAAEKLAKTILGGN